MSFNTPAAVWLVALTAGLLLSAMAHPAAGEFQIVWVQIGDAASSADTQQSRAGRRLFMASDVADMSLKQISVSKVEATPAVTVLVVGERFCVTALTIVATGPDHVPVKGAPLSVSIRQDHRDALGLDRREDDICVRPSVAGEYPMRFTSVLPATDGTNRGAQIYLRVSPAPGG